MTYGLQPVNTSMIPITTPNVTQPTMGGGDDSKMQQQFKLAIQRGQPPLRSTMRETSHPDLNVFANFFLAAASAVPARAACHAFSVIRIRAEAGVPGNKMGPSQSIVWTMRLEGYKAFLKTLPLSAAKSAPFVGLQFGLFDVLAKNFVPTIPDNKPSLKASAAVYLCGGIAGSVAQALLHPIDLVKTRIVCQGVLTKPTYENEIDCVRKILAKDGWAGLYRGFTPSVVGAYVFTGQMFMLWDFLHRLPWRRRDQGIIWFESIMYPIFAIAGASFCSSPFDVVRRKMMAYDPDLPKRGRVDVVADTVTNTIINSYRMNGLPGFFHGYFATAAKVVPQLAVFWITYKIMQISMLSVSGGGKGKEKET